MLAAIIIEPDRSFATEISSALEAAGFKGKSFVFGSAKEALKWVQPQLSEEASGAESVSAGAPPMKGGAKAKSAPQLQVSLIIIEKEQLDKFNLNIIRRIQSHFKRKLVSPDGRITGVVVTAFDAPGLSLKAYENKGISNVVLKPFDRPILVQHLAAAANPGQFVKEAALYSQKTSNKEIEMLKQVELVELSEVGFKTKNPWPVEVGKISKYQGGILASDQGPHCFGKSISSVEIPSARQHLCEFRFYATEAQKIGYFRRQIAEIQKKNSITPYILKPMAPTSDVMMAFLDSEADPDYGIKQALTDRFKNSGLVKYRSLEEVLMAFDPSLLPTVEKVSLPSVFAGGAVNIALNSAGQFLGTLPELTSGKSILGFDLSQVIANKNFLIEQIYSTDKARFTSLAATALGSREEDGVFVFKTKAQAIVLWRVSKRAAVKDAKLGDIISIEVRELTEAEKQAHLKKFAAVKFPIRLFFISDSFFKREDLEKWTNIKEKMKTHNAQFGVKDGPKMVLLSSKVLSEDVLRQLGSTFDDILFFPGDRLNLARKLKVEAPDLALKENLDMSSVPIKSVVSVVSLVGLVEVSESMLTVRLTRQPELGSFSSFVIQKADKGAEPLEILAICHHSEPCEGGFLTQFIFFGISDKYLKLIRNWMKSNYIDAKQGA